MQDRSYIVAMVVVLAICCLGIYVAVSGYLNSNPSPVLSSGTPLPIQATLVVEVTTGTGTPEPTLVISTLAPLPTGATLAAPPLGVIQTVAAATGSAPTGPAASPTPLTAKSPAALPPPPALPAAPLATPVPQGCTTPFCPQGGPPDASLGPGGIDCPRNYIFGRVVDLSGQGLPDRTIRFTGPSGEVGSIPTKNSPDPRGSYNLPTGQPGNTYTLWLVDAGGSRVSPQVPVTTQAYSGGGLCPTRLDFVQQR